jgi:hypothetical protein
VVVGFAASAPVELSVMVILWVCSGEEVRERRRPGRRVVETGADGAQR